jgi:hypothetical protein
MAKSYLINQNKVNFEQFVYQAQLEDQLLNPTAAGKRGIEIFLFQKK